MRRRMLSLAVLFVISTLTLASLTIAPATSQDKSTIISKLDELKSKVEGERPALENKVEAVIHQVEAGAFNGALNKLQNDVKKSIIAWVDNPEDLIKLVDEIIDLIKGITPPPPTTPDFEISGVLELDVARGGFNATTITITSINNFTGEVDLTNSTTASGVTLSLDQSSVSPPANGTATSTLNVTAAVDAPLGSYVVTVTAVSVGFEPKSWEIDLEVIQSASPPQEDTRPPTIGNVLRNPETPAYNESVAVTADVYDTGSPAPSGVKQVMLNYSLTTANSSVMLWVTVDMTLNEGLYRASIPASSFGTRVLYRVQASDNNGNAAWSILFSYGVIDPYPPLLRIDNPTQGSYLSGTVPITVFMEDQNSGGESGFQSANLTINNAVAKTWNSAPAAPDTYNWNTKTFLGGLDGVYTVKLSVNDTAGNVVEKSLTVTVDNTLPTAAVDSPASGTYLRLSVLIEVTGSDVNFDKMELRIDNELVKTSFTSGSESIPWNTGTDGDGVHSILLRVYDRAGNIKEALVNVTVDNTAPVIGIASWSPNEPAASVDIRINVTVSEPSYGSGVKNVTLAFSNSTMDWRIIPMELEDGNWTATLSNQSDTEVRFFIQAFDIAGNSASTGTQNFTVAPPSGFPLAWILAAIAVILVGTGIATYYLRRRQKKGTAAAPPVPAVSKPTPPSGPTGAPAKPPKRTSQREFQVMLNTMLDDRNAPKVDYSRYVNA